VLHWFYSRAHTIEPAALWGACAASSSSADGLSCQAALPDLHTARWRVLWCRWCAQDGDFHIARISVKQEVAKQMTDNDLLLLTKDHPQDENCR
jgi:hypothetical protein